MSQILLASRPHLAQILRAVVAPVLVALAFPAAAAQGSLLEITVGPHDTDWLEAKKLNVTLDGKPLAVKLPAKGADPATPVYSDVVTPGPHKLDVDAGFIGDSKAFSYVEGYVFEMKGNLDIEAPAGQAIGVHLKVVKKSGLTTEWTDKFKLALRSGTYPSDRAAAAQVADPTPPPDKVAAAEPEKPATEQPVPAKFEVPADPVCKLEPPRFGFDKYALHAAALPALDVFASCLLENRENAVIEGFADPRGSDDYNQRLSAKRADAVVDYLVGKGVARSTLMARAYGKSRLVCSEATADCYARNRRAEAVTARP